MSVIHGDGGTRPPGVLCGDRRDAQYTEMTNESIETRRSAPNRAWVGRSEDL